jgi:hypothetical protein
MMMPRVSAYSPLRHGTGAAPSRICSASSAPIVALARSKLMFSSCRRRRGLGGRREDRLRQRLAICSPGGSAMPQTCRCLLVVLPARADQVAAHHRLDRHRLAAASPPPSGRAPGRRSSAATTPRVDAGQVVGHDVAERSNQKFDIALSTRPCPGSARSSPRRRPTAVGGDHQQLVVADRVVVAHLAAVDQRQRADGRFAAARCSWTFPPGRSVRGRTRGASEEARGEDGNPGACGQQQRSMTAALPKSLARLPSGLISKLSRSTAASIPVFSSSTISTSTTTPISRIFSTSADRQQQRHRDHHRRQPHLLAERVLVRPRGAQAVERIARGVEHALQSALALERAAVDGVRSGRMPAGVR